MCNSVKVGAIERSYTFISAVMHDTKVLRYETLRVYIVSLSTLWLPTFAA